MMENLQLSTRKKVWLAAAVLALLMWTVLMPLRVNAAETGEVYMSTDYPGITVRPGETTTFDLYFTNSTDEEMDMELSASDLPEGWSGYFRGSSSEVSRFHVYGDQTKEERPS